MIETAELYTSTLHWLSVGEGPTENGHWATVPHSSDSVLLGVQASCLHLTYKHTFLGKHVTKAKRCLLFTHGGLRLCRAESGYLSFCTVDSLGDTGSL